MIKCQCSFGQLNEVITKAQNLACFYFMGPILIWCNIYTLIRLGLG